MTLQEGLVKALIAYCLENSSFKETLEIFGSLTVISDDTKILADINEKFQKVEPRFDIQPLESDEICSTETLIFNGINTPTKPNKTDDTTTLVDDKHEFDTTSSEKLQKLDVNFESSSEQAVQRKNGGKGGRRIANLSDEDDPIPKDIEDEVNALMMRDPKETAIEISKYLKDHGILQIRVKDEIGVSKAMLSMHLNGSSNMSAPLRKKLYAWYINDVKDRLQDKNEVIATFTKRSKRKAKKPRIKWNPGQLKYLAEKLKLNPYPGHADLTNFKSALNTLKEDEQDDEVDKDSVYNWFTNARKQHKFKPVLCNDVDNVSVETRKRMLSDHGPADSPIVQHVMPEKSTEDNHNMQINEEIEEVPAKSSDMIDSSKEDINQGPQELSAIDSKAESPGIETSQVIPENQPIFNEDDLPPSWQTDMNITCPVCDREFATMRHYNQHIRSENVDLVCGICGFEGKYLENLKNHLLSHLDLSMTCIVCKEAFTVKTKYNEHLKSEHPNSVCGFCNKDCHNLPFLKAHLKYHKESQVDRQRDGQRRFREICVVCKKEFTDRVEYDKHLGEEHPDNTCNLCGKKFNFMCHLKTHLKKHGFRKEYKCTICERQFNYNISFKIHMMTHTNLRPFLCDLCGKSFSTRQQLSFHSLDHTGERPHKCKICSKRFKTRGNLKIHQFSHSEAREWICQTCSKAFKTKAHLVGHMLSHKDAYDHPCTKCEKSFKTSNCLKMHLNRHEAKKRFPCKVCGKLFQTMTNCQTHTKSVHTDALLKCPHCDRYFKTGSGMRRHQQLEHNDGNKPFMCQFCGKDFPIKAYLMSHIKSQHDVSDCIDDATEAQEFTQSMLKQLADKPEVEDTINTQEYQDFNYEATDGTGTIMTLKNVPQQFITNSEQANVELVVTHEPEVQSDGRDNLAEGFDYQDHHVFPQSEDYQGSVQLDSRNNVGSMVVIDSNLKSDLNINDTVTIISQPSLEVAPPVVSQTHHMLPSIDNVQSNPSHNMLMQLRVPGMDETTLSDSGQSGAVQSTSGDQTMQYLLNIPHTAASQVQTPLEEFATHVLMPNVRQHFQQM
ncbi:unnamed protein product [Owenia fusiformis]|uniref:Uncharacterized protein n=1 Tax=Owenia fusiformis TaxID=6347 RepID=A0A8J1XNT3_OWEFU|nr:unnamed protein product [Owenia fusiformis]